VNFLSIIPAYGTFLTTESLDVVVVNHVAGRVPVGGQVLFDGADVTATFVDCVVVGTLAEGGQTFRCPGIPARALGAGPHTLEVRLELDDGTLLRQAAGWTILAVTEPGTGPGPVTGPPSLVVTLPSGQLVPTQRFNFAIALTGGGRSITGQRVSIGALDVSDVVVGCPSGSLLDSGLTQRCGSVPASLFGLTGIDYVIDVALDLDD
jgi:hypothetical protein